jgi:hypothetical protein
MPETLIQYPIFYVPFELMYVPCFGVFFEVNIHIIIYD